MYVCIHIHTYKIFALALPRRLAGVTQRVLAKSWALIGCPRNFVASHELTEVVEEFVFGDSGPEVRVWYSSRVSHKVSVQDLGSLDEPLGT